MLNYFLILFTEESQGKGGLSYGYFPEHSRSSKSILLSKENLSSDKIKIVSLSTFDDQTFPESHRGNIHEWIANEFGAAIY